MASSTDPGDSSSNRHDRRFDEITRTLIAETKGGDLQQTLALRRRAFADKMLASELSANRLRVIFNVLLSVKIGQLDEAAIEKALDSDFESVLAPETDKYGPDLREQDRDVLHYAFDQARVAALEEPDAETVVSDDEARQLFGELFDDILLDRLRRSLEWLAVPDRHAPQSLLLTADFADVFLDGFVVPHAIPLMKHALRELSNQFAAYWRHLNLCYPDNAKEEQNGYFHCSARALSSVVIPIFILAAVSQTVNPI